MKINKSSPRSSSLIKGSSKVDKTESHEPVESVEGADPTDRYEMGSQGQEQDREREEEPAELDEVLKASMEDPVLYQEVARSALLGMEELPTSVDTTWNGVATLLDERD